MCEREAEIRNFDAKDYFVLTATVQGAQPPSFAMKLVEWKGNPTDKHITNKDSADKIAAWCQQQRDWDITKSDRKQQNRRPRPVYHQLGTAGRIQPIKNWLETMYATAAEIIRRRTHHLSPYRQRFAQSGSGEYGAQSHSKQFRSRILTKQTPGFAKNAANAQEAHEAIRPTNVERGPDILGSGKT